MGALCVNISLFGRYFDIFKICEIEKYRFINFMLGDLKILVNTYFRLIFYYSMSTSQWWKRQQT